MSEVKTATHIPEHDRTSPSGAKQRHYRLSPPLEGCEHVVVSSIVAMFSGPETYIFPGDENGNVSSWGELEGSYRGGLSHEVALENAGYSVARN